jgi:putative DNA-invertase from lambdoid prophage Rac
MAVHSYLRISTLDKGQSVENQRIAIRDAGFATDYWYAEEGVSGSVKALLRPEFAKLMSVAKRGDLCVVTALDRLGRDAEDILNTVNNFEKMGVRVCILALGNTDVTSVMGKAFVIMLSALAEMERNELRERTKRGLIRVAEEGTFVGRPLVIEPAVLTSIVTEWKKGKKSLTTLSREHGLSKMTVSRNVAYWGNKLGEYAEEFARRSAQYKLAKAAG